MKNSFNIRNTTIHDIPEIQAILDRISSDWSSSILKDCFQDHYFQWVICRGEVILGFAVVKNNLDLWEIMQIMIDQNEQRQGLATQLLQFVITQAKKWGTTKLQLEVRQSNTPAIRLYQKNGFQKVGLRKKYYADHEDAVLMDCNITLASGISNLLIRF